jgi:hypothetical protein
MLALRGASAEKDQYDCEHHWYAKLLSASIPQFENYFENRLYLLMLHLRFFSIKSLLFMMVLFSPAICFNLFLSSEKKGFSLLSRLKNLKYLAAFILR